MTPALLELTATSRARQHATWRAQQDVERHLRATVTADLMRWAAATPGRCPVPDCAGDRVAPRRAAPRNAAAAVRACFEEEEVDALVQYELTLQRTYAVSGRYTLVFPCASCSGLLRMFDFADRSTWLTQLWIDLRNGWRGTPEQWLRVHAVCRVPRAV